LREGDKAMKKIKLGKEQTAFVSAERINTMFNDLKFNKEAQKIYNDEMALFNFIESVNRELKKKHMSKYALAKKIGLKPFVVSRILDNAENAQYKTLRKIAHGIGKNLVLKIA
jgi:ribosome-binding protein aMBF1 (putative translation factor)